MHRKKKVNFEFLIYRYLFYNHVTVKAHKYLIEIIWQQTKLYKFNIPHRFLTVFYVDWLANLFIADCELERGVIHVVLNEHFILYTQNKFFIKVEKLVVLKYAMKLSVHQLIRLTKYICEPYLFLSLYSFLVELILNMVESNNCFKRFCFFINK